MFKTIYSKVIFNNVVFVTIITKKRNNISNETLTEINTFKSRFGWFIIIRENHKLIQN